MTQPSPDPPVLQVEELMARLGHSTAVLAQLVPVLDQSIASWQGELDAAQRADDVERLRRAAHQAKGALLTFAAPRAAAAARALEDLAKDGDLTAIPAARATLMTEVEDVRRSVRSMVAQS